MTIDHSRSPQLHSTFPSKAEHKAGTTMSTPISTSDYTTSWERSTAEQLAEQVKEFRRNELGEQPQASQAAAGPQDDDTNTYVRPYLISLTGIPGSGKKISAFLIASFLEDEYDIPTMVLSHGGYHLFLDQLRLFSDPEDAIYRRGAPDTFDPAALERDLLRIKEHTEEELIKLPGFDHAKGDPEPEKATFDRTRHQVVIVEGLYMLYDDCGWETIRAIFDYNIYIQSNLFACLARLKIRNLVIPGYTEEEVATRVDKVDRTHAELVLQCEDKADLVVQGMETMPENKPLNKGHRKNTSSLASLMLSDVDEHEAHHGRQFETSEWQLDIQSRPHRSESMVGLDLEDAASEGVASEAAEEPPEPASHFVGTWEPEEASKILKAVDEIRSKPGGRLPYMVALVGGPGSGKSISSFLLANELEKANLGVMVTPHDGYHYTLDRLMTFPDAADYKYRRGAPDTFDPLALERDLDRIRNGTEEIIKLPAFDHARADPEPDTHIFDRNNHQVVICEGLYLLHDEDGWESIADMFDYSIYIDTNVDLCMERVKIRNQCIPGYTPEEIAIRVDKVDRVNALTVRRSQKRANSVVVAKHAM